MKNTRNKSSVIGPKMELKEVQAKSIGLVLSGGGVRGMAHIGMLKAFEAYEINASIISGTSIGALVGALYANGNSIEEMLSFFKNTPLFKYSFFTIQKPGLIDTERFFPIFKTYFPENSFEALQRKLYVVTTNLQKGEAEVFSEGELIKPLLASTALPPIYSPVTLYNGLHADGGIMNNFPIEDLKKKVNYVIGSNVSIIKEEPKSAIRTSLQLTNRITGLMIYASSKKKLKKCDLIFEPQEVETIGMLDKKGIEKAFTIGYDHAMRVLSATFSKV